MQNRRAARPFVQVIDVLGDEGQARDPRRQGGDGPVSGMGRGVERLHPPPRVPAPNQVRIAGRAPGALARSRRLPGEGSRYRASLPQSANGWDIGFRQTAIPNLRI